MAVILTSLWHLSDLLCSVLLNEDLVQELNASSSCCFMLYFLHPVTSHIRDISHSAAFAFCMRQATGMSVINHRAMRAVRALSCLSNVCSLNSLQLSNPHQ